MQVIQNPRRSGKRVLVLGTFDGVHCGHRALIRTARDYAKENGVLLRVCTFDRHPLEVVRPDKAPPLLTSIPEKALQLCRLGVDEMELIHFDRREAEMEPEDFLASLREKLEVCAVAAGWNYTFGRYGKGNAELLREDGRRHGYDVLIEPPMTLPDGQAISSSLIRQTLSEGKTETAAELLGYYYTLTGTVTDGKHKGHRIGFPTANVTPWHRKALPAYGVYTCLAEAGYDVWPALVNIGIQPTIPSGRITVESHILTGNPDLYGEKVRLTLLKMLRRETRFESEEQLREQIGKDRDEAIRLFGMA